MNESTDKTSYRHKPEHHTVKKCLKFVSSETDMKTKGYQISENK